MWKYRLQNVGISFRLQCAKTYLHTIKRSRQSCFTRGFVGSYGVKKKRWWRHQMETFSALLAICAGNSPVPVNSPHKGQWRWALTFSLICAWINDGVNNREAGDLRRHRGHYDVIVMQKDMSWKRYPLDSPHKDWDIITLIKFHCNVPGVKV